MACKGLLWVGTDAGISLTVPLPRLEGVPIISGRVNVSYHAHVGPVRLLLPLQDPPTVHKRPPSKALACDVYGLYGQLMYVKNYEDADDDKLLDCCSSSSTSSCSHWSLSTGGGTVSSSGAGNGNDETGSITPNAANVSSSSSSSRLSGAAAAAIEMTKREQTLVTVTSGRGYVNYQQPCCTTVDTNAHIILWELKL